jgi:vacuolar protein sorting-associated protein 35
LAGGSQRQKHTLPTLTFTLFKLSAYLETGAGAVQVENDEE